MSWLNNNLLVLLVTTALYFGMRSHVRRYNGWAVSLGCGGLTAVAFLTKQTYVLSFAAFATVVIMGSRRTPLPTRFLQLVAAGALTLLLTSVYWAPNLAKYGTPIYSPIQGLRLPTRYLGREIYDELRTVSFGKTPYTYRRVVAEIGMREFVRREIARDVTIVVEVIRRGVIPLVVAFAGLILVRRRHWFPYALALTMAIAPIFDSMYWIAEPRYLYPLYPIMLFASGLAIARYRACERWGVRAPLVHRLRVVFGLLLLATVVRTAVEVPLAAHQAIFQARTPPPAWAATVSALPADAVLLTSASPTHVAWWSRHRVVVEPILSHDDLVAVMAMYKPQYYFDDRPNDTDHARFETGELTPIASGDGWRLYRIEPRTRARADRG